MRPTAVSGWAFGREYRPREEAAEKAGQLLDEAVLLADDCGAALKNCGLEGLAGRCDKLRTDYDSLVAANDVEE